MGENVYQAGSVVAQLKSEFEQFDKGFQKAGRTMEDFGQKTDRAQKKVAQSGREMATGFDRSEKAAVRMIAGVARVTAAMTGLQAVMETFTDPGSTGEISKFNIAMTSATKGLTTFAALAVAVPHPVGVAAAAIAGLATAFVSYGKAMGESLKIGEEINKQMADWEKKRFNAAVDRVFTGRTLQGTDQNIALLKQEIADAEDKLRIALKAQEEARVSFRGGDRTVEETEETIKRADILAERSLKLFRAKQRDLAIAEATKDREVLATENRQLIQQTEMMVKAGLLDPIEAVRVQSTAADAALKKLLDQQTALEKVSPGLGAILGTDIGLAVDKAKRERASLLDAQEVQRQADNFGSAIGEGLRRGILSGQSAMETLANIGSNLFENMVNDLTKNLTSQLSSAFNAIAGAGGSALSTLLTAGLGVAGAVLSKRGGKFSESFNPVQSQVTSTQAVRGIVAGPTSVSIAQISEDIGRAFEPSRLLLAEIASTLRLIHAGGGRSMRSPSLAGSTPTT
jgi:hypothetical protein